MADSDCSMSSTNAQLTAMGQTETEVKDLSPLVSSDVSSTDSDPSTTENTLTSLTPDPDFIVSQTECRAESGTQTEETGSYLSSSCTCQSEESDSSPQKRRRKITEFQSPDWYKNKCFDRYWKHYKHAMTWCRRHYSVMKTMRSRYGEMGEVHMTHPYHYVAGMPYNPGMGGPSVLRGRGRGVARGRGMTRGRGISTNQIRVSSQYVQKNKGLQGTKPAQKSGTAGVQTDEESLEMEITEEMIKFFAHSEKHRKERDASKDVTEEGVRIQRVNIEKANKKVPTCEAPKERPGLRRTEEMVQLYGKGAAMIHGMETALQMTYDRNTDIKQPKLWPNMPLKLVFN